MNTTWKWKNRPLKSLTILFFFLVLTTVGCALLVVATQLAAALKAGPD